MPQALLPHQSAQVPDVTSAGAQPLAQPQTQLQQVQAQLLAEAPGPQQLQQEGAPAVPAVPVPSNAMGALEQYMAVVALLVAGQVPEDQQRVSDCG